MKTRLLGKDCTNDLLQSQNKKIYNRNKINSIATYEDLYKHNIREWQDEKKEIETEPSILIRVIESVMIN